MPTLHRSNYTNPFEGDPGPYEALVVSHLDSEYMGGLQVELLKAGESGNQPERTGQIVEVKYMSPFGGQTPVTHVKRNDGYEYSQKSYGWWAVPPDIGTKVLVIFVQGDISRGYWIGCIQDQFMNFMTPGNPSTTFTTEQTPEILRGKKLPTAEYNKFVETGAKGDPTFFNKPYHKDFVTTLRQSGLLEDETRGTNTSSARREVPSSVFGVSTPGPRDKRTGAPKGQYGQAKNKSNVFANRLGGSSFVMDDGDDKLLRTGDARTTAQNYVNVETGETGGDPTKLHNELVRLKTRTGHQILLHNSEDLIYISNANGTAWIELTANGKIDIYGEDSISIRTGKDFNFHANRDLNFSAGANCNFIVGGDKNLDIGTDLNANIGYDTKFNIGNKHHIHAGNNISLLSENRIALSSRERFDINSQKNLFIGTKAQLHVDAVGSIFVLTEQEINASSAKDIKITTEGNLQIAVKESTIIASLENFESHAGKDHKIQSESTTHIKSGTEHRETAGEIHMNTGSKPALATSEEMDLAIRPAASLFLPPEIAQKPAFVARTPDHEPWYQHENNDPVIFDGDNIRAGTVQKDIVPPKVPDTFRKSR